MSRLLAGVLMVAAVGRGDAQDPMFWERRGCEHGHGFKDAKRGIDSVLRSPRPLTRKRGRRAHHFASCTVTARDSRRLRRYVRRLVGWRKRHRWVLAFARLPAYERSWARSTSWCESSNRNVHSGPHHSYFQWKLTTWWDAGGVGDPHVTAGWHEQAVRAVRYAQTHGRQHWPVCGT